MRNTIVGIVLATGLLFSGTSPSRADTVLDYSAGPAGTGSFGDPTNQNGSGIYGQTFTTPADSVLDSFTFYLAQIGDAPTTFRFSLFAFDGTNVTGDALFTSALTSTSVPFVYTPFEFQTGGISLSTGAQYAALLIADASSTGIAGALSFTEDVYAGGAFLVGETTDPHGQLIQIADAGFETAFKASFSSAAVPEPGTFALLGASLLPMAGAITHRRRKA